MHPAEAAIEDLMGNCRMETTRRQGPGGQHRNKVETAVIIRHLPSGISAEANEKRSQAANRKVALFRLRLALATQVRGNRGREPSPLLKRRIRAGKFSISPGHEDFPAVLAEVMDRLHLHQYQVPAAAEEMGVTGTQLLKLLKGWPPAFEQFNRERESRGLHRIKF